MSDIGPTTTSAADEDRVRQRAYELWDEAGRPEGRQDEYWYAAERQLAEEESDGTGTPGGDGS